MNILISGVAGFLGSHLAERMLLLGHRVYGFDTLQGGDRKNVPDKAEFWKVDCCDFMAMKTFFPALDKKDRIDLIYHCAATPHEGLSVFSPNVVTHNVYQSTVSLATAAIAGGVKRFVFLSSMARYGRQPFVPFTEDCPPNPVDPYGVAKLAAEKTLEILSREHRMEFCVAVPHNIIGEKQRYVDPYRNVAAIFINLMLQGKQPTIYGDGMQRRVFSYVGDCIDPLVKMGTYPGMNGAIINIGPDDNPVTILELAQEIARQLAFDLKPKFLPARPCEVKEAWPSAERARKWLEYRPQTTLPEALSLMIADIRARGPRPFEYNLPLEIVSDRTPATWKERLF